MYHFENIEMIEMHVVLNILFCIPLNHNIKGLNLIQIFHLFCIIFFLKIFWSNIKIFFSLSLSLSSITHARYTLCQVVPSSFCHRLHDVPVLLQCHCFWNHLLPHSHSHYQVSSEVDCSHLFCVFVTKELLVI